ncbi:PREDICTED: lisH domain-containing protein FOPNL-like isoform X2 [Priapulus caudatus]|nr:PREDICTED: lisH domain-containing protein FOPNL-like isoform X2 [Priapulus caudatus]
MRAEIFRSLEDTSRPPPRLTDENLLINELIREYLLFNNYRYTESVLVSESGLPEMPLDRELLTKTLNVTQSGASSRVPLLYGILSYFSCPPTADRNTLNVKENLQTSTDQDSI